MEKFKDERGEVKLITLITIILVITLILFAYVAYNFFQKKETKGLNSNNPINLKNTNIETINLNSYLGEWYESEQHFSDTNPNNLSVKEINNNQIIFDLYITRTANFDDVSVSINNNKGTFEAITENGPSADGNTSKITGNIELENNTIKLTIDKSNVLYLNSNSEYVFKYKVTKELGKTFSDEQVKNSLADYLELKAHANCDALLEKLTEKRVLNYNSSSNKMQNDGTVVTSIKFSDYKKAMLNYVSESEFEKNWTTKKYFNESSNGYLTKAQGGGGLRVYTIKNISKVNATNYTAKATSVVEDNEYLEENDLSFVIASYNGKCVIDSLEEKTEQSSNQSEIFSDEQVKKALSDYLELKAHANCDALLEKLTEKRVLNYNSSSNKMQNDGTVVTSIKFSDYKKAMLNYVSESEFEKNWTTKKYFNESSNGYLTKAQGGGGLRVYTIKNISKVNATNYTAKATSVVEDNEYFEENNLTFAIASYNGKCVIDSCNE